MLQKFFRRFIETSTTRNVFHRTLRIEQCEARCMLSAVPVLQSNPDSSLKIFLDFDGHAITDAYWTNPLANTDGNGGDPIHAPVYNMPGDSDYEFDSIEEEWKPLPFSQEELEYIEMAWRIMAEDFAPFDVDVTTVEPREDAFKASGGPDGERAVRVLFTSREDDGRLNGTANASNGWLGQSSNWVGSLALAV